VSGDEEIPFSVNHEIEIIRSRCAKVSNHLGIVNRVMSLAKAVPADSDVIVASYYLTTYSAILAKLRVRSARLFYIVQGYEPNYFCQADGSNQWFSYYLACYSYRLPLHKTAISSWLSNILISHGVHDVTVINNGINSELFSPCAGGCLSDVPIIMTVGNRRPNRGFFDFCDAANLLWKRRKDFRILIIGTDSNVTNGLNLPFDFLIPCNDEELVIAYRSALIYVTCSHEEGFGLTPLEAMSCETAVVCTDSGGVRDFAIDDENCLMVPVRDVNQIAEAIDRLLDDQECRARLIEQGRKTALRFDWTIIGRQYERVFCEKQN